MRYKLAVSDFDGTLLRGDDTVSERTVAAIESFRAAGGIFGISTGRAFSSIRQRMGELGLSGNFPVMCCQGAFSADYETGEIITQTGMDRESAAEFLRRAERRGLTGQFYTAKNVYVPELNETNKVYFETNRIEPVEAGVLSECAAKCNEPILKVLCYITPQIREEMFPLYAGIKKVKMFTSGAYLFEAVSENAGKGNGLIDVCRRLGVPVSQSVAFGDELNDVDMIQVAGLGVAMGNARAEAKAAADTVTSSCERDGVAEILEKIVAGEL